MVVGVIARDLADIARPLDVPRVLSKAAREASGLRHGEYEVKTNETFECLGLEWIYEERPSRDSGCRVTIMAVNVYDAQERLLATLPHRVLTDDFINAMEAEIAAEQDREAQR